MFFDMDLLCRQRQGKFGIIWLAATRGLKTINRKDIESVNIKFVCNEILKYVMSHSTSPKKRLSLFLSAKLLYGTVLIYKQQVVQLEQTMFTFYFSIEKPKTTHENKRTKTKAKEAKKSKQPETRAQTQEEQIRVFALDYEQGLPDGSANVINSIHITLPDADNGRLPDETPNLFGDEGQTDQQLAQLCGENWINIPDAPIPEEITNLLSNNIAPNIAQVPEPINIHDHDIHPDAETTCRQMKRVVSNPEESPSKRKRVDNGISTATAVVVTEAQVHQQGVDVEEPRTPDNQEVEMPPPRRPPIRRRLNVVPRPRPININVGTPRSWQRTPFDRLTNLETSLRSPIKRAAQENDPKDIIALILAGVQHDENDIISVVRGNQENNSIESVRVNLTAAVDNTLARTIEPIVEQDIQIQEILATLPQQEANGHISTPIPPVASPHFSRILGDNEDEVNISHVNMPPPRLLTSTPKSIETRFQTAIARQNNLLDRIRAIFLNNGNSAINLEQLCDQLNRSTISTTFSDLLYLHGKLYIRLDSVSGTIELEKIYPGDKLFC